MIQTNVNKSKKSFVSGTKYEIKSLEIRKSQLNEMFSEAL